MARLGTWLLTVAALPEAEKRKTTSYEPANDLIEGRDTRANPGKVLPTATAPIVRLCGWACERLPSPNQPVTLTTIGPAGSPVPFGGRCFPAVRLPAVLTDRLGSG
jgi:hypothetical protein